MDAGVFLPVSRPSSAPSGTYPLSSLSRAALFAQAERMTNEDLAAILAEHIE
jgi:hypothetical protein